MVLASSPSRLTRASTSAPANLDLLSRLSLLEQRGTYDEAVSSLCGWETVRHLGTGSFGRCYLLRKPDGSLIVHKRLPVSHMSAADQEVAEREVNILASFDHPHIVRYQVAFVRQGQLNIVMEYASGGDLATHVRERGRPGVEVSLDWFVQLLLALEHVHAHRVPTPAMWRCRSS